VAAALRPTVSFQETAHADRLRHQGEIDPLIGLKENVIIGKLISPGTGMQSYRAVKIGVEV
jgi:DNA-directed RNA polymerase subunit beta'